MMKSEVQAFQMLQPGLLLMPDVAYPRSVHAKELTLALVNSQQIEHFFKGTLSDQ